MMPTPIGRLSVGAVGGVAVDNAIVITLDPMLQPVVKRRKHNNGETVEIVVNKDTKVEVRAVGRVVITVPTEGT